MTSGEAWGILKAEWNGYGDGNYSPSGLQRRPRPGFKCLSERRKFCQGTVRVRYVPVVVARLTADLNLRITTS